MEKNMLSKDTKYLVLIKKNLEIEQFIFFTFGICQIENLRNFLSTGLQAL